MATYFFEKWKDVRKSGLTLFSMLSLPMRVYSILSFAAFFSAIVLYTLCIPSVLPWFPISGFSTKQFMGKPFFTYSNLFLLLSIVLMIVMILIVSPIDRDTERLRLDDYYENLKAMLVNEGITDSDICEAICTSIQMDGERGIRRIEYRWGFVFNLLLFFGGAISAFIVDSYIEDRNSLLHYEWIMSLLFLMLIVLVMLASHALFSKQANTPNLKLSCAADLRIAFYYGTASTEQNDKTGTDSSNKYPKHLRPSRSVSG